MREEVPAMSEQKATSKSSGDARRATQALVGVGSAVACLAIGWAVGIRSAVSRTTPTPVAIPITQPIVPTLPVGSGDDNEGGVQWGTLPGSGLTPAQPGVGIAPPSTGSGGSTVAAATSALAPAASAPAPATTSAPAPTTNTVSLTTAKATGGGQR
jgi:hypothetical protein